MSPKNQDNVKLASWFMVVDQRKSTGQSWGSLDPISYNFCHMKIIPSEELLKITLQTTFMLRLRASFAWKVIFMVKDDRSFCLNPRWKVNFQEP